MPDQTQHRIRDEKVVKGGSPLGRSGTILLLVDFINPLDFEGAEQLARAAVAAGKAAARLKADARRRGIKAIYANDNYGLWQSDFTSVWRHCKDLGGAAGGLASDLRPEPEDLTVLKPRHSAFYCTPLELLLQQLRCKRIVVTGLATDSCVLFTAMDAYLRGYEVWVPADCAAAESARLHRASLRQMQRLLKAHIAPAFGRDGA